MVFSYGFCRDSDMENSMKKFVIEMCVSNLEKYSDNSLVSLMISWRNKYNLLPSSSVRSNDKRKDG